jgi:phosphoribosylanthranilate isomerase
VKEPVRVKICGLTRAADVVAAAEAGADYLGFVFSESPRRVSATEAGRLIAAARETSPRIECVGVFVDVPPTVVEATREALGLDRVQLHGGESPAACRALGCDRVIKSFRLPPGQTPDVQAYGTWAVLLEGRHPSLAGGGGMRADWEVAASIAIGCRLFLAGGLDPWNVRDAVRSVGPFAVDVSSGVESAPGIKDGDRIRRFIDAVRAGAEET